MAREFFCPGIELFNLLMSERQRSSRFIVYQSFCHVFCYVNKYRTFSSLVGNAESVSESVCQIIFVIDKIIMFCNRECNSCNAYLLESITAYQMFADICGYKHRRNAVHIRCGNPRNQIGRSRPAG